MRVPAFWDTSALIPLCVRQGITPRAIALYKLHDAVVWWATPVEIASAFARLVRMKRLDPSDWTKARKLAKRLADSWSVIQPSDALRAKSAQLVDRFDRPPLLNANVSQREPAGGVGGDETLCQGLLTHVH